LRELEDLLPQPSEWTLDGDDYLSLSSSLAGYLGSVIADKRSHAIPIEVAKLYIFDDLSVSQRWANKFSEVGIETVADLIGKTEEELLRIEGIGGKALEELKAGLEERDLLYILDNPPADEDPDVNQLIEMVFSPDDSDLYMSGEVPLTYSVDPDDEIMNGTLTLRTNHNDAAELDQLLDSIGMGIEDETTPIDTTEE
jgi:DNA-directed RNA polymerase subunit beta'